MNGSSPEGSMVGTSNSWPVCPIVIGSGSIPHEYRNIARLINIKYLILIERK